MNHLPHCSLIKESFLAYVANRTMVHEAGGECVITVPISTLDNRLVDVYVESYGKDFFRVHDSGKAVDELFLQGVSLSARKSELLLKLARHYSVSFSNDVFTAGCTSSSLDKTIWAVAHASSMAMTELLRHSPGTGEDELVKSAVEKIITSWGSDNQIIVGREISVRGELAQHTFDFVAQSERNVVAINVLSPGSSAIGRAQRYGFQGLDLLSRYPRYQKMAVLANPDSWSNESRHLVKEIATRVVEFSTIATSAREVVTTLDSLFKSAA